MQKKSLKKFFTAIFFLTTACATPQNPYLVSTVPEIQNFEKQDHNFCIALKLDFDKTNNLKSGLYWRCRLSLAKYRLYTDKSTPEAVRHNATISDLIGKISLKLASTPEAILLHENKKTDNRQHRQCLVMGFVFDTEDQAKIDEYFACRKALIEDMQLVPPYGNNDYLQYPNRSYNLGFAIDQRIDAAIKRYNEAKAKYPTCVKFNLNSVDFRNCTIAQDKARQCFSEIDRKKFKKEGEEKIVCQKQSYIRFPDSFLKEEDRNKADRERMKINSDFYNKSSFAALGMKEAQFDSDEKRAQESLEDLKKEEKNINSKEGLYNKYELTRMRQRYIFACQKEADGRINKFVEDLKKDCEEMERFELIGEE